MHIIISYVAIIIYIQCITLLLLMKEPVATYIKMLCNFAKRMLDGLIEVLQWRVVMSDYVCEE